MRNCLTLGSAYLEPSRVQDQGLEHGQGLVDPRSPSLLHQGLVGLQSKHNGVSVSLAFPLQ
jgi:hypothetical protein